jgi:hypothetical protein
MQMFNFFRSAKSGSGWLGSDEWLFALKLQNVSDPFDPHPLWESRYSGVNAIAESISGRTDRRLRDVLDAHRCILVKADERGWRVPTPLIFGDVVIRISEAQWNSDIRTGAKKIEILADNLSHMHDEDFGDKLCSPRPPSYAIVPDPALGNDEVVFQFGLGVFVPGPADQLTGQLQLQIKDRSDWMEFPEWTFWENGKPVYRPVGLYEGQQFLLIAPSSDSAAICSPVTKENTPVWFSHGKGRVMLNFISQCAFGDGEFVSDGEIIPPYRDNGTICRFHNLHPGSLQTADPDEELLLKIIPFTQPDAGDSDADDHGDISARTLIPGTDSGASSDCGIFTLIPGLTEDHLVLEGFALPRIDTPSGRIKGLRSWTLWVDESGQPIAEPFADASQEAGFLALSATSVQDFLSIREPGKKYFAQVKKFPVSVTAGIQSFQVIAPPIPEKYHAILKLSDLAVFPIEKNPLTLGRGRGLGGPDILLEFLANPESLRWQKGQEAKGAYLGAIGLSRRHVQVRVQDGQLRVRAEETSVPVYGLDQNVQLRQTLEKGSPEDMALESGEYLLIGCYLLRFERA